MTSLIEPTVAQPADKQFGNLRALLALEGYALWRSSSTDGHVSFFASGPDGMIQHLWSICDVERLLDGLKGRAAA